MAKTGNHKQCTTLLIYHFVKLKIISLYIYIYKERLRNLDLMSRDHYHEDGYLVPSPPCGFCFEAVFQL